MRGRGPLASLSASPTMVGAVTTLIVIVAVFLAYNANNGLPFVPVYRVSVEVPNSARLTNNNEVRIGGHRVGVVESIDAITTDESNTSAQTGDGEALAGDTGGGIARLNLKLDKATGEIPKDSIFRVRYRSSFGLKYLEIIRGTGEEAPEGFTFDGTDDGATCAIPLDPDGFSDSVPAAAKNGCFQAQTEFDDINNTFNTETRTAGRKNLVGFGNAFAGRGTSLNDAINSLEPLFRGLGPVARALSAEDTQFARFFKELGDSARIVAPVAEQQAELFTNMAIAFNAISSDRLALQETIAEGPATLETGIRLLPRQQPFLREFATLSRELRPGIQDLRATLPVLNDAIVVGTPVLERSVAMNRRLKGVFRELNELVTQPSTKITLQRLEELFDAAKPLARWVVPAQTVCNYWNYWFTFTPNGLSDRDQVGYAFRQALAEFPASAEVEAPENGYAAIQSNGRTSAAEGKKFEPYKIPILNGSPYQPTGQRNADCQGGQRGYTPTMGSLRVAGQGLDNPASGISDLPGSRGPTTLFYNDQNQRELVDTRRKSRSPESWRKVK